MVDMNQRQISTQNPPSPQPPNSSTNEPKKLISTKLTKPESSNSSSEIYWTYLFIFVGIICFILLKSAYEFRTSPATAHIPKGQLEDLLITLLASITIAFIKYLLWYLFKDYVLTFMNV